MDVKSLEKAQSKSSIPTSAFDNDCAQQRRRKWVDKEKLEKTDENLENLSEGANKVSNGLMSFGCNFMIMLVCAIILVVIYMIWNALK